MMGVSVWHYNMKITTTLSDFRWHYKINTKINAITFGTNSMALRARHDGNEDAVASHYRIITVGSALPALWGQ